MGRSKRYLCWFIQFYKGRGYARPHFFTSFSEQTMRELIQSGNIFTSEADCLKAIQECKQLRLEKLKDKVIKYEDFEVVNE